MGTQYFGYVYITTNTVNNKIYIGQHKKSYYDEKYLGSGVVLGLAQKKYGKDKFVNRILSFAKNQFELDILEKTYIQLYKSFERSIGYNIARGGEGGDLLYGDEEARKNSIIKMIKTRKEKHIGEGSSNPMYKSGERGIHPLIGTHRTIEERKKISQSLKGHIPWNKGLTSISKEELVIRSVLSYISNKNVKPVKCTKDNVDYYFKQKKDADLYFNMDFKRTLKGFGNRKNIKATYIEKQEFLRYGDLEKEVQ